MVSNPRACLTIGRAHCKGHCLYGCGPKWKATTPFHSTISWRLCMQLFARDLCMFTRGSRVAIWVEWVFEDSCIVWVSSTGASPLKLTLSLAPFFFFMHSLTLLCTCCSWVKCMNSLKTKSCKHGMSRFVHIHLCIRHASLSSYVDVPTLEVKIVIWGLPRISSMLFVVNMKHALLLWNLRCWLMLASYTSIEMKWRKIKVLLPFHHVHAWSIMILKGYPGSGLAYDMLLSTYDVT